MDKLNDKNLENAVSDTLDTDLDEASQGDLDDGKVAFNYDVDDNDGFASNDNKSEEDDEDNSRSGLGLGIVLNLGHLKTTNNIYNTLVV